MHNQWETYVKYEWFWHCTAVLCWGWKMGTFGTVKLGMPQLFCCKNFGIMAIQQQPRRADSRFAPNQWETALLCIDVSHWLGASLESALQKFSMSPYFPMWWVICPHSPKNSSEHRYWQQGITIHRDHFNGLGQERWNSSALAMELRLSCTNLSILWLSSANEICYIVTWLTWSLIGWVLTKNDPWIQW